MGTTWTSIEASFPIATFEYSFGPGIASSLALAIDGGIAIVSPPCNVTDAVFEGAAKLGPVKALVASNAFHHMGLAAWKQRFPDARLFAPAQAVARVTKQSRLSGIAPLSELTAMAGKRVDMIDLPHFRTGEVLVRARTDRGCVWYATDILMNMSAPPPGLIGKLFAWSNSAPGFKFSNLASLLMVKDKKAIKRWLIDTAEQDPPRTIVMSHGAPVELSDPLPQLREVIKV